MTWNWQKKEWPEFHYDTAQLQAFENMFLLESGKLLGAFSHFDLTNKAELTIALISHEACKSSEIEGDFLNRDSLQSSIRRHFGLATDQHRVPPTEQGMSDMMLDLYQHFDTPLTQQNMFNWHEKLMLGRRDLHDVACYRTDDQPMQVVSGYLHKPKVHFEAPPSSTLQDEMSAFIDWFNRTAPNGEQPLPALQRAGLAHFYFVSIHPFEDGNGRIARALSGKVMAQSLGQPTLIALSHVIEKHKKDYYLQLNQHNRTLHITAWLTYFAKTALQAIIYSQRLTDFLIAKTKLYDRVHGQLNARQEKVLQRLFKEGTEGFKGGLSAKNYINMTGASRATATRDLQKLLELQALRRTGTLKNTRYQLNC